MKLKYCFFKLLLFFNFCNATELESTTSTKINNLSIILKNNILTISNINESYKIEIESEKILHLEKHDYNFDGKKDFAIWHLDEGNGVYKIYRLFIFDNKEKKFNEISPSCGDEFINITVDARKKIVSNTYFEDNTPKICLIHISK